MNEFNVGDIVCGTENRNKVWNATFTAEVMLISSYDDLRVRFLSWKSPSPYNQWESRDENELFWYPSSFFQLLKQRTAAEMLFIGD